ARLLKIPTHHLGDRAVVVYYQYARSACHLRFPSICEQQHCTSALDFCAYQATNLFRTYAVGVLAGVRGPQALQEAFGFAPGSRGFAARTRSKTETSRGQWPPHPHLASLPAIS